ncbi:hypothetical protein C1L07_004630 [Salmonella enterica subsp. enterica serovar Anatum]|uniref:Uncharacterized protein n=1 Tax=Salmonella enterica TaxID=28901 RepID=A0A8E6QV30_SALER|nr:hypothetical protein [Salmonella enterica]ECX3460494.1 hypothetical protein [Salmonella enterica subsp. enterica serovar Litchfield]EDD4260942.1 hypothetical protein [Salmonella enterica subsp. enterica serovar Newport]EDI4712628.1 hypothetical protein [Salmonella enterica subsp. enterica serovar Montevideo]EDR4932262.1 hypothetical protein [Salmonella enterica subsp. enterica serovar Braenderup]EDU1140971.1 hypothetical protein [Salmonella enterica subsp. enterica serovar Anatum]EDW435908
MDFMSILGRLLLLPIYAVLFVTALFSQADDKFIVMGLSMVFAFLSWQITKPVHKQAEVA